jgi:glycosyltransferase involved in cell wall biosynthesis
VKRVLWVTEEPPDRALGGGNIRQAHLLLALAGSVSVDLVVAGPLRDQEVRAAASAVMEVPKRRAFMPVWPPARRAVQLALAAGARYPLQTYAARPARRALRARIGARLAEYELVCLEHEGLAPLLFDLQARRSLLTFHNLQSEVIRSEVGLAPGRRQRWFRTRELAKACRAERRALDTYDRCVVCSADDAAALRALAGPDPAARIDIVPNGADLGTFREVPLPEQPVVLFPGTFGYVPNIDAAVWFCSKVWPRVLEAVPRARLILAGRSPAGEVLELAAQPSVEVRPDVPSMVPLFEAARLVVVPLRIGSGTRVKALEALAAGRPVVGTTTGLAGLDLVDGVHARMIDRPAPMAEAIIGLLGDTAQAASMAQAGREHVRASFSWELIGRRFTQLVGELLETPPRQPAAG